MQQQQQTTNELDTTALEIASQPQVSMVRLFLAFLGDVIAFIGLVVTVISVWDFLIHTPNPFLKFLIGIVACGPWLALLAFCTAKVIQYFGMRDREKRVLSYVDALIEAKRDENKRANEAHAVDLHLKQTRISADERGNRDFIYDPTTRRVIPVESGNFIQPVPNTIHYSVKNDAPALAGPGNVPALPVGKVQPPTFEEVCSQVERNSGMICLGRSLKEEGVFRVVELRGSHLLLIGSTQKGKSTQAAAIMDQLCRTHDREHIQLALLDLEDNTCNLFANDPHVLRIGLPNGRTIKAVARSPQEVAQYLSYMKQMMEDRYRLSPKERAQLPRVIIYLEEFLELKRTLKGKDLADMADDFTTLATRGLKANMHLMVCAQASYSQEEFREAMGQLVGINMGFCAPPKLAQAAGFWDYELLKANFLAKIAGQFVLEATGCTDLVAAPNYQLKKKLEAIQEQEEARLGAAGAHYAITEEQEVIDGQDEHSLLDLEKRRALGAHPTRTLPAPHPAPAWEAYIDVIEQLQNEGHTQDPIIEKIWHAKKGSGNQKYLTGREIYRKCNEVIKQRRQTASESSSVEQEAM